MPRHGNRWKDLTGMRFGKLKSRIHNGWNPVDALTKPIHHEFASKGKVTA